MSRNSLLNNWINEYCSPVVGTIVTPEVERICLKNGLLFHELLSAFGHLDGIHATIRSNNQMFSITDAHIRFERSTEIQPKSFQNIEDMLQSNFEEQDMRQLPSNVNELRANPVTAWTPKLEQILCRSLSFSEYEMISHPAMVLTVVSSSDKDVIASMQELSPLSTLSCLQNGQYEPDVHRVYLLLHDASDNKGIDVNALFRKLQGRFPAMHTKLLVINSLSAAEANVHQPDMWSRYVSPVYFRRLAPTPDASIDLPINPINGNRVLGSRLSMEDFMALRDFCIALFHQDIAPAIERRIQGLTRLVSDARKGVKNVIKSFWRKPREEVAQQKGAIKYRFDRIEAQILLLADSCFIIRDYDTAVAMYKLVRDDFRADKSYLHLAHCGLMSALACWRMDPGRRDLPAHLEAVGSTLQYMSDVVHAPAYFAFLASELLQISQGRNIADAALLLLQAISVCSTRMPLLCALLTERAAALSLIAGLPRRYALHEMTAGLRMHACGSGPRRHALVCFAQTLLLLDRGFWGAARAKLAKYIADEWRASSEPDLRGRALILLLRVIDCAIDMPNSVSGRDSASDAVRVLRLLCDGSGASEAYGLHVRAGWQSLPVQDLLLGKLGGITERLQAPKLLSVCEFSVPHLDQRRLCLLCPTNGFSVLRPFPNGNLESATMLTNMLIERNWQGDNGADLEVLVQRLVLVEDDKRKPNAQELYVGLGEPVLLSVRFANRLSCELQLNNLVVELSPEGAFEYDPLSLSLGAGEVRDITLKATPTQTGKFSVLAVRWNLSPLLSVRQSVNGGSKDSINSRALPLTPQIHVVAPCAHLRVGVEGFSPEMLVGEIVPVTLTLANEGCAAACNICVKSSHAGFVFLDLEQVSLSGSCTVFAIPADVQPGEEIRLKGHLRLIDPGTHKLVLAVSYQRKSADDSFPNFGPSAPRVGGATFTVQVVPSVCVAAKLSTRPTSALVRTCIVDVTNLLPRTSTTFNDSSRTEPGANHEHNLHVEGVLCSGAKLLSTPSINDHCSVGETTTLCIPLNTAPNECVGNNWSDSIKGPAHFVNSEANMHSLLNAFVKIEVGASEYAAAMKSARLERALQEQQETAAGPRSISQVRKDRDKEKDNVRNSSNADEQPRNEMFSGKEGSMMTGRISLVVFFSGNFKGKQRFGVCYLPSLQILQHISGVTSDQSKESKLQPEFLQIQCFHPHKAELQEIGRHVSVTVTLVVRNLRTEEVSLNVEAIDRRGNDSVRKPSSRGLRWDRKTRYCNILLAAGEQRSLVFHALLSRPGVFDLKRFRVSILSSEIGEVFVTIPGQSLIEVEARSI